MEQRRAFQFYLELIQCRVGVSSPARNHKYGNDIYQLCPRRHSLKITSKIATTSPLASWSSPGGHFAPHRLHAGKSSWKNVDRTELNPLYPNSLTLAKAIFLYAWGAVTVLRLL
jgi:hypothetical protein